MHAATFSLYCVYGVIVSFPCITGVQVAEMMLLNSHDPNPVITGSSVHNQRIERIWRDVFRCVLTVYYQLFYHLEESDLLDPLSDIDLYCLYAVYMHKINEALSAFMNGWNRHAVTTEHSMTPVQLMAVGSLLNRSNLRVPDTLASEDDNSSIPGTVEVPRTPIPLDSHDEAVVQTIISTSQALPIGDSHSIDTYRAVQHYTYSHIQIQD